MTNQDIQSTERNPYNIKLKRWEEEITAIEKIVDNIPSINLINLGIEVFNQLRFSQRKDFSETILKLEKIRSGIKKMIDTLSYQSDVGGYSDSQLDNYSERMITLLLKTNRLAKEISKKNPQKHLQVCDD